MNPVISDEQIAPNCGLLSLECEIHRHLHFTLGHNTKSAKMRYLYRALAIAIRDRLIASWNATEQRIATQAPRRVHYLSLEFLIGRSLSNAVYNIDLEETTREALSGFGGTLEEVAERERDAGLGNGGLGRLAACFLDSCANLQLPVRGYGIRYEYGMFHQRIENGRQVEEPDHWLLYGNPWELERSESTRRVKFYGRSELYYDAQGVHHCRWVDTADILAVPFDMPIPGFRNKTVNTLRLWKAAATHAFDLNEFNAGGYSESVAAKNMAEKISMVLYPNDASENGKELRLKQQYFLVSASLQDVLADWVEVHGRDVSGFGEANCFQLNDTHPACAVPELMRLLMDDYGQSWDQAWAITTRCMAYTNHTLLPEALERWSVRLFSRLLPRLAEIIFEINRRFLIQIEQKWPGNTQIRDAMSLVEGGHEPHFRMAYLSIVGCFSVNGVAHLHTELLKSGLFENFHQLWPEKFNNKTNGVTHRRWLAHCNPGLRSLIGSAIGDAWERDLSHIEALIPLADDAGFRQKWRQVKSVNKTRLSRFVEERTGVCFMEHALFDVQVKRIHEYKRQLLNVLHVIHLYDRICRGDTTGMVPRCVLIGGKAAPGYFVAKVIIKLINNVGAVINSDPKASEWLKLVFLPNYQVSAMEIICPGTELSEQISTAGKEASGTGNMKFMMNGALTIGTLDGANIEIREKAGADNFFLFGLNAAEVAEARMGYDPNRIINNDPEIRQLMELLEGGRFSANEPGIFDVITGGLRNPHDPWLTIADLRSYIDSQREVAKVYRDVETWNRMSIINTASSGWFSSDRTIGQYAEEIWQVRPVGRG
ncbi:MAG: glycogen/starch/alpha-glucan phosphorylase [Pirellulaceae bacterium]|nr:glycogen/starch/alpha-glucan phosphorylase [Pirellulaceae bacterium]